MDTPSHFFNDCMDFEDPNPYQSPEQDVGDGGPMGLQHFQSYDGKLGVCDPPTSPDGRELDSRADVWDSFADHIDAMSADQKPMFVDPGLYGGDSDNDGMQAQIQVLSMGMSRSSTRRTSSSKSMSQSTSKSGSTSTDVTPPDQGPQKKRKSRKATKKEPSMVEDEGKRNKFLERNRIAASKCREKKKQYVSDLEEHKIGLETQHAHLQMEYNGLLGEVSGLKHHLMAHAKCNDPNIDRWLNNEARRFVQTSNELFGQPFAGFGQTPQSSIADVSPRSRNPSIASAYQALQGVQFDNIGTGERQGSMSYSHGPSLYTPPTESGFPCLSSPSLKREPGINYDHMPDAMFNSEEQSAFRGG
ncbi:hypothetical protein B0H63DRAFT_525443 [Podospora didyma]|uniref:BZIP domain-containing protein n=1 Tax=Podospora didyma TaxID=330526 RepID=A0AAE0NCB3_9PEZI|nr:hypothetical protein B0H63DRAFT_525443 [Podospora didyma]